VRRLAGLVLVVAALTPALLLADDEGAGGPPSRTKEQRRVLDRLAEILEDTSFNKTKSALAGLRDASWAVRAFAAIRLGVVGLDEPTVRSLRDAARPGSKPPAADDAKVAAAETFAKDVKETKEKSGPERKATAGDEGIRSYASLVRNELSVKKVPAEELRALILSLPAFAEAADDVRARNFIARELLALCESDRIVKELSAKDVNAAVGEDGKKVFEWFRSNEKYLYLHPKESALHLDVAARSDATPTDKYREKNPWAADEGPNAPPRKRRETK